MVGQLKGAFGVALVVGAIALLAVPAFAAADQTIHVKRGGKVFTVVVAGNPRPSDLDAIREAKMSPPPPSGGARASYARSLCGRSVRSHDNCGTVPAQGMLENQAQYRGKGTVRVCAISAVANRTYPNGDPRYAWRGSCGNNSASAELISFYNTPGYTVPGWWINNTVVNASPYTHTIWQVLTSSVNPPYAGVCQFEAPCW